MYPKKELAQIIISACRHFNIETVVISGSRNAPLTIGSQMTKILTPLVSSMSDVLLSLR